MAKWRVNQGKVAQVATGAGAALTAIVVNGAVTGNAASWVSGIAAGLAGFASGLHVTQNTERPEA